MADRMNDFRIDKLNLDMECIRQAELYKEYSDNLASAVFNKDKCKEELAVLKAEVDSEIRADPSEYGFESVRPTETAIINAVIQDSRVVKKTEEYLESCYQVNVLEGSKWAMEQKKTALELIVKLYVSGYWADPHVSKTDGEQFEKQVVDEESVKELESNPRMKRRQKNG